MVEIAISLAIIGFAMVAIIGVLPIGMTVQKDNREETVINQDATVLMNAIRNGAWGLDDLTNYVTAITIDVTRSDNPTKAPVHEWFYYTNSSRGQQFALANGYRIVGLLSTPKYDFSTPPGARIPVRSSNHVVAYIRSMSGTASEKFPPNPRSIPDLASSLAFSYRMTSEVIPFGTNYYDPSWVASGQQGLSANEIAARSNSWMVASNLQTNLHDLRLTFAWPFTPQGVLPKTARGQSFRTLVSGQLVKTNEFGYSFYYFQPRNYVKVP